MGVLLTGSSVFPIYSEFLKWSYILTVVESEQLQLHKIAIVFQDVGPFLDAPRVLREVFHHKNYFFANFLTAKEGTGIPPSLQKTDSFSPKSLQKKPHLPHAFPVLVGNNRVYSGWMDVS